MVCFQLYKTANLCRALDVWNFNLFCKEMASLEERICSEVAHFEKGGHISRTGSFSFEV